MLVNAGCSVNYVHTSDDDEDYLQYTLVHTAAWYGNLALVKFLLSQNHVLAHLLDTKGRSPLQYAVLNKQQPVIDFLLEVASTSTRHSQQTPVSSRNRATSPSSEPKTTAPERESLLSATIYAGLVDIDSTSTRHSQQNPVSPRNRATSAGSPTKTALERQLLLFNDVPITGHCTACSRASCTGQCKLPLDPVNLNAELIKAIDDNHEQRFLRILNTAQLSQAELDYAAVHSTGRHNERFVGVLVRREANPPSGPTADPLRRKLNALRNQIESDDEY